MVKNIKHFNNKLNDYLGSKNIFKLNSNDIENINIEYLNGRLNHFCFIFKICINLLNEFFKSKYDLIFNLINDKDKIIEQAFDSGLLNNEKVWKRFLNIFNEYNEESIYALKKNFYKDSIEFIYNHFYEFEYLVKTINHEIFVIENNIEYKNKNN